MRFARLGSPGALPPIVLAHGYPDDLQIFSRLAPLLAHGREVLAFDWPGMGESEEWHGGASPTHMAERLVRLLDAWEIERVHVAGIDMGGQPAIIAASRFPTRIAALTVSNSLVAVDAQTSWEIQLLRKVGLNRLAIRSAPRIVFARAERTFLPASDRLDPETRSELWTCFRQRAVRRYVSRMCTAYSGALSHLADHFARIGCPTHVLWGSAEKHFPLAHAEQLHAAIPGAVLTVIEGGQHWMCWHRAQDVAAAIVSRGV